VLLKLWNLNRLLSQSCMTATVIYVLLLILYVRVLNIAIAIGLVHGRSKCLAAVVCVAIIVDRLEM